MAINRKQSALIVLFTFRNPHSTLINWFQKYLYLSFTVLIHHLRFHLIFMETFCHNRIITAPLLKKIARSNKNTHRDLDLKRAQLPSGFSSCFTQRKNHTLVESCELSLSHRPGIFYINYNFIYFLCHRRLICCQLKFFQCLFTP